MVIAGQVGQGAFLDQPAVGLLSSGEPLASHPLGRSDGGHRIEWVRDIERAVLAAKEPGGGECLELFDLGMPLQPLADVDEWWDRRVPRSSNLGDPRAEMGAATVCGGTYPVCQ